MNASRWLFIPLLAAAYFLVTGNGILAVLIPYRAHSEGISAQHIAQVGSGYFAGMLGGAFLIPLLIHRFGAMRAFAFAVSSPAQCIDPISLLAVSLSLGWSIVVVDQLTDVLKVSDVWT